MRDHLLVVDDEDVVLKVLRWQLTPFEERCAIDLCASAQQALDLIDQISSNSGQLAVIIADQSMPGLTGVELLERVHRRQPEAGKILLTGRANLDIVTRAVNRAALDRYIAKPWEERDLHMTVETLLTQFHLRRENARLIADLREKNASLRALNSQLEERVRERTQELAAANQQLTELVVTDGLTGVRNHRYFDERFALETGRSRRSGRPLALLMIDIDSFKHLNDERGHLAGDHALRVVASLTAEQRRATDMVARFGGDEFVVLLPETTLDAAAKVAHRIHDRVATTPIANPDHPESHFHVTVSVGVASYPDNTDDPRTLVQLADGALYAAKSAGRNRVHLCDRRPQ